MLSAVQAQSTFLSGYTHFLHTVCKWKIHSSWNTCCIFLVVNEHTLLTECGLLPLAYRIPFFSMRSFCQDSTRLNNSIDFYTTPLTTSTYLSYCKLVVNAFSLPDGRGLKGRRHIYPASYPERLPCLHRLPVQIFRWREIRF